MNNDRIIKVIKKGMPVFVREMRVYELDRAKCSPKFLRLNMEPEHKVYVKVLEDGEIDFRGKNGEYRLIPMTAEIAEQPLTIAEHIKMYVNGDRKLCGPGGEFSGGDLTALMKVMDGTGDNYVVFNNGGGKYFTVLMLERIRKDANVEGFQELIECNKAYVFMYKINGVETILKSL